MRQSFPNLAWSCKNTEVEAFDREAKCLADLIAKNYPNGVLDFEGSKLTTFKHHAETERDGLKKRNF